MAERSAGEIRSETIARMRVAFREGLSATRFIGEMKTVGLSYRRTAMLADWRSINELEQKKDLLKYVRKDYYPTEKTMAAVSWELSQEYMYKVKVSSRIQPGAPLTERFVNILSDVPMTPGQVSESVVEKWAEWEKYQTEIIEDLVPWTAVHKVME